jgi:hypothetical protein
VEAEGQMADLGVLLDRLGEGLPIVDRDRLFGDAPTRSQLSFVGPNPTSATSSNPWGDILDGHSPCCITADTTLSATIA